eukprot:861540-Alexandrium_andersonii.AAC.1
MPAPAPEPKITIFGTPQKANRDSAEGRTAVPVRRARHVPMWERTSQEGEQERRRAQQDFGV